MQVPDWDLCRVQKNQNSKVGPKYNHNAPFGLKLDPMNPKPSPDLSKTLSGPTKTHVTKTCIFGARGALLGSLLVQGSLPSFFGRSCMALKQDPAWTSNRILQGTQRDPAWVSTWTLHGSHSGPCIFPVRTEREHSSRWPCGGSRTTNWNTSKELGPDRENPYSVSTACGIMA